MLPESVVGRVLLWGAIPVVLFLLTLGISFVSAVSFANYLPFLVVLGGLSVLFGRTLGLGAVYFAFFIFAWVVYKEIPIEERLWQLGLAATLAVDFFVLFLAREEIEGSLASKDQDIQRKGSQLLQMELTLQSVQSQIEADTERFEQELAKLKAEAEQRRIEREVEQRKFQLIEKEIDEITAQKEDFLTEAREGRKLAAAARETQEILENQITEARSQLAKQQEGLSAQKSAEIDSLEAEYKATCSELERVQRVAEEQQKECRELQAATQASHSEIEKLKKRESEVERLEEELTRTKREVAGIDGELKRSRAEVEHLKIQLSQSPSEQSVKVSAEFKAALAQAQGNYKQLRVQFDEKAQTLSETRQELFRVETQLLANEHVQEISKGEAPSEELVFVSEVLAYYESELRALEQEIIDLEMLVTCGQLK